MGGLTYGNSADGIVRAELPRKFFAPAFPHSRGLIGESHATIFRYCNRHPHRRRRRTGEPILPAECPCCRGLRKRRRLCQTNLQREQKEANPEDDQGQCYAPAGTVNHLEWVRIPTERFAVRGPLRLGTP